MGENPIGEGDFPSASTHQPRFYEVTRFPIGSKAAVLAKEEVVTSQQKGEPP